MNISIKFIGGSIIEYQNVKDICRGVGHGYGYIFIKFLNQEEPFVKFESKTIDRITAFI